MQVEELLFLLRIIGTITAFAAAVLVAIAVRMGLLTPPKALKQYIIDTTPEPEPEPTSKTRVVTVTVPPEVQTYLDSLLPTVALHPEWDRMGGAV